MGMPVLGQVVLNLLEEIKVLQVNSCQGFKSCQLHDKPKLAAWYASSYQITSGMTDPGSSAFSFCLLLLVPPCLLICMSLLFGRVSAGSPACHAIGMITDLRVREILQTRPENSLLESVNQNLKDVGPWHFFRSGWYRVKARASFLMILTNAFYVPKTVYPRFAEPRGPYCRRRSGLCLPRNAFRFLSHPVFDPGSGHFFSSSRHQQA